MNRDEIRSNMEDVPDYKLKHVCHIKDGRVMSGVYPYLAAMARHEVAEQDPNCLRSYVEDAD